MPVCLHGQSVSGITDAAQHHLGLSTPNLTDGNQIMHQLLVEDLVSSPDLTPRRGKIGLLDAPGLGVELDRDAVARAAERYREGGVLVKVLIADQKLVTEIFPMEEAIPTMRRALTHARRRRCGDAAAHDARPAAAATPSWASCRRTWAASRRWASR